MAKLDLREELILPTVYIEGKPKIGPWRDTHLQITGDAVATMQVVFAADWYFVINENLTVKNISCL
jgi:cardiolipin synthase A/B